MKTKVISKITLTLILTSIMVLNLASSVQAVTIDIDPNTLNIYNTNGNWITAYIEPSVLFSDDFETYDIGATGSPTWTIVGGGTWGIEDDSGNKVYSAEISSYFALAYAGDMAWTDLIYQTKVKKISGLLSPPSERYPDIFFRYQDFNNFYYVQLRDSTGTWNPNELGLYARKAGGWQTIQIVPATIDPNVWYTVKIDISGTSIKVYLCGGAYTSETLMIDAIDTVSTINNGAIGIGAWQSHAHFDDVLVTDIDIATVDVGSVKLWHMMFSDDFEADIVGDPASNWNPVTGTWLVEEEDNGNQIYSQNDAPTGEVTYAILDGTSTFTDGVFEARVKSISGTKGQHIVWRSDGNAKSNYYWFGWAFSPDRVRWGKYEGGVGSELGAISRNFDSGVWYTLKVVALGTHFDMYLDGELIFSVDDASHPEGSIGFHCGAHTHFDDVVVLFHIVNALDEPTVINDYDSDMIPDRMIKFDRATVCEYLYNSGITSGDVDLVITGQADGMDFNGGDSVRVIAKGKCRFES